MPRTPRCSGFLGILLFAGCFVGDAADGLPCEVDADCGVGVSCAQDPDAGQSCCGGSCLVTEPTSTGVGTTTDATMSGTSSTTSNSESSTGELCGNGTIDAGEECDSSDPGSPPCSELCTLCGNAVLDDGEACDEPDNDNCDPLTCQYIVPCGNGVLDDGELCDPWGLPPGQTCSATCDVWTAFAWVEDDTLEQRDDAFCVDEGGGLECARWVVGDFDSGPLRSGAYFQEDDTWDFPDGQWPQAILRTRPIPFPPLEPMDDVRIEIHHRFAFNYNMNGPVYSDFAEVAFETAAQEVVAVDFAAEPSHTQTISCGASPASCDPPAKAPDPVDYCADGFTALAGGFGKGTVPGTASAAALSGRTARLRLRAQYDCGNFDNGKKPAPVPDNAWLIHGLTITVRQEP